MLLAYLLMCHRPLNARELAAGASSVIDVVPEKKEIHVRADKAPADPFVFDQVQHCNMLSI